MRGMTLAAPLVLLFFSAQVPPSPAGLAAVHEYQIGPDDILKITVYGHDDLTQTVVVQADGTFVYPLVGRVSAIDLTPKELARKLTDQLAQGYIRNPQLTVVVQEYRSKVVYVVGEVSRPGTYPLSGSGTLVEMLSRAGPMTAGAGFEVVIVRPLVKVGGPVLPPDVPGEPAAVRRAEVMRVNIREVLSGDIDKNVALRPNDTVYVPPAPKVFVSGEGRSPGAFSFNPGRTGRQVASLAGRFAEDAAAGRIRVVRSAEGKSRETKIKLDETVLPGDTIVVKAKLF